MDAIQPSFSLKGGTMDIVITPQARANITKRGCPCCDNSPVGWDQAELAQYRFARAIFRGADDRGRIVRPSFSLPLAGGRLNAEDITQHLALDRGMAQAHGTLSSGCDTRFANCAC